MPHSDNQGTPPASFLPQPHPSFRYMDISSLEENQAEPHSPLLAAIPNQGEPSPEEDEGTGASGGDSVILHGSLGFPLHHLKLWKCR